MEELNVAVAFGSRLSEHGRMSDSETFRSPPPTHYDVARYHEIAHSSRGPRRPNASFRSNTARLPDSKSRSPGPGAYEFSDRKNSRSLGWSMRGSPRDQGWIGRRTSYSGSLAEKPRVELELMPKKRSHQVAGDRSRAHHLHVGSHRGRVFHGCTRKALHRAPAEIHKPSKKNAAKPEEPSPPASPTIAVGTGKGESRGRCTVVHPEMPSSAFASETPREVELYLGGQDLYEPGPGDYETVLSEHCIAGHGTRPHSKASFGGKSSRFSQRSTTTPEIGPGCYFPQEAESPRAPPRSRTAVPGFNAHTDRWKNHSPGMRAETPGPGSYRPQRRPASSAGVPHSGVGFGAACERFSFWESSSRSSTPGAAPSRQRQLNGLNAMVRAALRRDSADSPGDEKGDQGGTAGGTPDFARPERLQPEAEGFLATTPRWAPPREMDSARGPGCYYPQALGDRSPIAHDFGAGPPRAVSVPLDFEVHALPHHGAEAPFQPAGFFVDGEPLLSTRGRLMLSEA